MNKRPDTVSRDPQGEINEILEQYSEDGEALQYFADILRAAEANLATRRKTDEKRQAVADRMNAFIDHLGIADLVKGRTGNGIFSPILNENSPVEIDEEQWAEFFMSGSIREGEPRNFKIPVVGRMLVKSPESKLYAIGIVEGGEAEYQAYYFVEMTEDGLKVEGLLDKS